MATPQSPIAARPCTAERGKSLSRSQRAAFGASSSVAKRRTASRMSSWAISGARVGEGVMAHELAALPSAFGDPVHAPPPELENRRRATHRLGARRRKKSRIHFRGERVLLDSELRLDRKPHRAISGGHQRRAVNDAAGALEHGAVRELDGAAAIFHCDDAESVGPQEARAIEQLLQRFLHASSTAMAVASPPPMRRL